MIARILPLLCLLSLGACDSSSSSGADSGAVNNNGNGDGDGDTNEPEPEPEPEPEADCEDGLDNDDDGLTDCEDDDCAAVFQCTWPDSMSHQTDIFFDGYDDVECEIGWWSEYEDVPDCRTEMSSSMVVATGGNLCASCDRTYAGPFSVDFDDCDDLTGDSNRPTEARFGFVFISETERELWTLDASDQWVKSISMTSTGGAWSFSDSGELQTEYEYCDNTLTIGMLNVTLEFVDQ